MNNKTIIHIGIGILIIAGIVFLFSNKPANTGDASLTATSTEQSSTSTAATTTTSTVKSGSTTKKAYVAPSKIAGVSTLAYLFSLKQSLVCAVTTSGSLSRTGTMYIADAKMRANFKNNTSMINDGEYIYVWATGATKGLKLSAVSSASGSAATFAGGFDPSTDITFSCSPWTKDVSVFTPPSSVTF